MLNYFTAERGFSFDNENVQMITATGAPGTSGDSQTVGVGSIYMDAASGDFYKKNTAGAGAANWDRMATLGDIGTGISWREPSRVKDDNVFANLAAAETELNDTGTPGNIGGVDSDQFVDGDRILFTAITGEAKNIFIVTGTPGSGATLVEDANTATAGDATFITEGTSAGFTFVFNGTDWILIGQGALTEVGFIQAFIGKPTDGNVLPQYTSNNHIADNDSLTVALGKIDDVLGAAITVTGNVISISEDVYDAIRSLDAWSAGVQVKKTNLGVTVQVIQDAALVDVAAHIKWTVNYRDASNNIRSVVYEVTHDGVDAGADATTTDENAYAIVKIGSAIMGLTVAFVLTGVAGAQALELRVTSTTAVDVRSIREIIQF